MGGTLIFKVTDDLKRIVEHAANNDPGLYYGMKIERSVFLVKDRGCYLMSAGQPGLLREDNGGAKGDKMVVQYAEGFHADSYDYDELRAVCGGDDFGEPLDVAAFQRAVAMGVPQIKVKLTAETIEVIF